jgi:hypothetical protein
MIRYLVIVAALSLLCRWALGKWPWDYLVRRPSIRDQAISRARRLLAVPANANRSEILAAHKRLVAMVHPDRGGSSEQVHEANAARDLLLDELPHEVPPQ